MLNVKFIRENIDVVKKSLKDRGTKLSMDEFIETEEKKRDLSLKRDNLRHRQKTASDDITRYKTSGDKKQMQATINQMQKVSAEIKEMDNHIKELDEKIDKILMLIPNIADESVPVGKTADDNNIVKEWGKPGEFVFKALMHWELGEALQILDFKTAAKIAGARFPLYREAGAALERALINFMLDVHIENKYTEILPPFMVTTQSMTGTGQLPKFEEELYKCRDDDSYLIPTGEVPLTNMHRDDILQEADLPIHYVAYTPCFRREAGSYGIQTKGLIRNHQFNKIELVKFEEPAHSPEALESLLKDVEKVLQLLEIPYRVVALCTGDMGFSASKTYDVEVWMPGEGKYIEISSCSNFTDFQARRANIRYRTKDNMLKFVHTLNGSGLAVGRTFAAIMENYQNKDGSITIPEVLRKYMHGRKSI